MINPSLTPKYTFCKLQMTQIIQPLTTLVGGCLLLQVQLSIFVGKCKIRLRISLEAQVLFEKRRNLLILYLYQQCQFLSNTHKSHYAICIYGRDHNRYQLAHKLPYHSGSQSTNCKSCTYNHIGHFIPRNRPFGLHHALVFIHLIFDEYCSAILLCI